MNELLDTYNSVIELNQDYDDGYFTGFMGHLKELLEWNAQDEEEEEFFV